MNKKQIANLTQHFNLGNHHNEPKRVYGGLLHTMWRLDTDKGSYAIKQLSKDINLKDESVRQNYELTEHIAHKFAALGIPAIPAISQNGEHLLLIDGIGFLVYPWVGAIVLDKDTVSETHALHIAKILAKMHLVDLKVDELKDPEFDVHDDATIIDLVALAKTQRLPFALALETNLNTLLDINHKYHKAVIPLKKHTVVSHGDLDQKNVLWDNADDPILIDWESARKLSPTYEIVNAALDWSGILSNFNKSLFSKMLMAYNDAGGNIEGDIIEAGLYGVLGNWINWMVYNIKRAATSEDPEQKQIGIEQVNIVLPTILFINDSMEDLIDGSILTALNTSLYPAHKLIAEQFPEYAGLTITDIEKQGHDNRTYRLGDDMLIRMPTAQYYAEKVAIEQELLPRLAQHLSIQIPTPIKMGKPSEYYPYPFSIYKWLSGRSINLLTLTDQEKEQLAFDIAKFLKELQAINVDGPKPGQHNCYRGDHVSVYDEGARTQIAELDGIIDTSKALGLWNKACETKWDKPPVWIHGDFAVGNMLMDGGKLSAIIDFGGTAVGDPACDLVIAWTYLSGKAREIFMKEMDMDQDTWLRASAWALWKATFELCQISDKTSLEAILQKRIIEDVIYK